MLITGTGMSPFGRSGTTASLAAQAVSQALDDSGHEARDVDLVVFANAAGGVLQGQEMIRGQIALAATVLAGRPTLNVENACASSSTAVAVTADAVRAGSARVAVVVGSEELVHPDRRRMLASFAVGVDLSTDAEAAAQVARWLLGDVAVAAQEPRHSHFMTWYAERAARYMASQGIAEVDVAAVAVKNRSHGALNPRAHFRSPVTVDEVLASRVVVAPLRLLMCAPISNGAAALVVSSTPGPRRVLADCAEILGIGLAAAAPDDPVTGGGAVARAVTVAYGQAGVGPGDLDLVELHDASAAAELELYDDLGLTAVHGDAAAMVAKGVTALGGALPVNASGGLLSRGHPVGATGAAQIAEIADQIRGRCGARQVERAVIGLVQNGGGRLGDGEAAAVAAVLARVV